MKQAMRIDLNIGQNLTMTPQLQQAIKLLQLNQLELQEHIQQTILQNPFLERLDETESVIDAEEFQDTSNEEMNFAEENGTDYGLVADSLDAQTDNLYDDPTDFSQSADSIMRNQNGNFDGDDEFDPIANYAREDSFIGKLENQISMMFSDEKEKFIALRLSEYLEPTGWLNPEYVRIVSELSVPLALVDTIVNRLQSLEPVGIFARNLMECIRNQLREKGQYNKAMQVIVQNMVMLANPNQHNRLAKMAGLSLNDLGEYMQRIRVCNPKPAAGFDIYMASSIEPDLFLVRGPKNEWVIELNDGDFPRIGINEKLINLFDNKQISRQDRSFASEKFNEAKWILKSLEQRSMTIMKVAHEIVKKQKGFFDFGVTHLRPLVLREIALAIQMHESTVSRVTANKYIATPRGLYELKYFFTSALNTQSGVSLISAEVVRHRIRKMIDNENPNDILSDDTIVNTLTAEGIDIARRTVAKYRESMHIPSSVQRRRNKKSFKTMASSESTNYKESD